MAKYRKIVLFYTMVGICWILGSDWFVAKLISDTSVYFNISIVKGVSFILLMSGLLYFLLKKLNRSEIKALVSESPTQLFINKIPNIFQSIPIVTYAIETDGTYVKPLWISDNVTQVLGYSSSEVLAHDWWSNCLHPDDQLRVIEQGKDLLRKGGGDHYYRFKHANGSYVYIHDELRPLNDHIPHRFLGIWHDVSVEERAQQETRDYSARLEKTILGTVTAISTMVEMRDPYTAGHELRVGNLAANIAKEMRLDVDFQYGLKIAGLVHDIGKISIPSEFLTKPTRLSKSEHDVIKTHAQNGYEILKNVDFPWPIAQVAYQHHERIDGSGYPRGLKGSEIILEAKILAVADVIESMATARPYRPALGINKALEEIEANAGVLYDKKVADAAIKLFMEKNYKLTMV